MTSSVFRPAVITTVLVSFACGSVAVFFDKFLKMITLAKFVKGYLATLNHERRCITIEQVDL